MNHAAQEKQSGLPQSGWFTDCEWAEAMQVEVKTFRENCRKEGVPFSMFGNLMIVQAEEFYQQIRNKPK